MEIFRSENGSNRSSILIDAETGAILADHVAPDDRALYDRMLTTITAEPLDAAASPWPYNGEPLPSQTREDQGKVSYIRPSPATGLYVYGGIGDPGGAEFIALKNTQSVVFVTMDRATGNLAVDRSNVIPADQEIFDRWVGTIKRCNIEVSCSVSQ